MHSVNIQHVLHERPNQESNAKPDKTLVVRANVLAHQKVCDRYIKQSSHNHQKISEHATPPSDLSVNCSQHHIYASNHSHDICNQSALAHPLQCLQVGKVRIA